MAQRILPMPCVSHVSILSYSAVIETGSRNIAIQGVTLYKIEPAKRRTSAAFSCKVKVIMYDDAFLSLKVRDSYV